MTTPLSGKRRVTPEKSFGSNSSMVTPVGVIGRRKRT